MSLPNLLLPSLSALTSAVFAALVLDQWRERRRSFQLAWALGLLWYGAAAGCEFWGEAFGWSPTLYRVWYLTGAVLAAAYLGAGTVYLLSRTRFGHVAAVSVALGGLVALAAARSYPGAGTAALFVFACALAVAIAVGYATARHRTICGHLFFGALGLGSLAAAVLILSAPLAAPGYAIDPRTHMPTPAALPGSLRVLSLPFNVGGGLSLILGAVFSAYVYMPKRKLMRPRPLPPGVAQLHGALAVAVNLLASLPAAVATLAGGRLNSRVPATLLIALGASMAAITSGLQRFGVTWAFFLGQLLGVMLIFAGFLVSEEVFHRLGTRVRTSPAGTQPG